MRKRPMPKSPKKVVKRGIYDALYYLTEGEEKAKKRKSKNNY